MFKAIINKEREVEIGFKGKKPYLNGNLFDLDFIKVSSSNYHAIKNNKSFQIEILNQNTKDKAFIFRINGNLYRVNIKDQKDLLLGKLGISTIISDKTGEVKAPMPGLILDILINEGQEVKKGTPLLILEAMKMENVLKSPRDGVIKAIIVKKRESVEKNQILIKF